MTRMARMKRDEGPRNTRKDAEAEIRGGATDLSAEASAKADGRARLPPSRPPTAIPSPRWAYGVRRR